MRIATSCVFLMVFAVLTGGSAYAGESSGSSHQNPPAKSFEERQSRSRFSGVSSEDRRQTDGGANKHPGNRSRFAGKSQQSTKPSTDAGSTKVTVQGDGVTVKVETPGNQNKGAAPPKQSKSARKRGQGAMGQATDKRIDNIVDKIVTKAVQDAMNQRGAGKEAKDNLDWVRKTQQSEMKSAFDNMNRANAAIESLSPGSKPGELDEGALDLGPADTLGSLE